MSTKPIPNTEPLTIHQAMYMIAVAMSPSDRIRWRVYSSLSLCIFDFRFVSLLNWPFHNGCPYFIALAIFILWFVSLSRSVLSLTKDYLWPFCCLRHNSMYLVSFTDLSPVLMWNHCTVFGRPFFSEAIFKSAIPTERGKK